MAEAQSHISGLPHPKNQRDWTTLKIERYYLVVMELY